MAEEFEIREAVADDAEKLLEYSKIIGGETDYLTFGASGFSVTVEEERAYLQKTREQKNSVHFIVWKDGEIVGEGSLSGLPRRMSHRAELGLAVKKAYWNRGIGGMLMEKLIAYAKENGIELLHLEVRSDHERAIRLYRKFGFQRIGTFPAFFKLGNEYFDFDWMYLDLRKAEATPAETTPPDRSNSIL